MHQTYYIDIDEEITSIVERLRKAKVKEVVIVVPKRALLIQSIVNLKLLKKEAERLKKEIIIVTQDKLGKMLIEKTGILVEQKLDDIEGEEVAARSEEAKIKLDAKEIKRMEVKNKLDDIGSSEYYRPEGQNEIKEYAAIDPEEKEEMEKETGEEIITNKELVSDIGEELKNKKSFFGKKNSRKISGSMDMIRNIDIKQGLRLDAENAEEPGADEEIIPPKPKVKRSLAQKVDEKKHAKLNERENLKVRRIEKMFSEKEEQLPEAKKSREKKEYAEIDVSGKFRKFLWVFGSVAASAAILAALYLFVPRADITIYAQGKTQSVDAEIKGDSKASSVDLSNKVVPVKIVSENVKLSETFDSTGRGSASNQKARGTITIYNGYSPASQPLVATTRFETADGKIFRLVKSIEVPGMTEDNGKVQPGTIDAQVAADASGSDYNIGPSTFSIPGFKASGTAKYAKIYAKSSQAMAGGGSSGETVKIISDSDVSNGENKLASDLADAVKQKIKGDSGNVVILDDAINMGTPSYALSASSGTATDNFSITANVKASAIVFNQEDVLGIVENMIKQNNPDNLQISKNNIALEFGKSDADFANGILTIRVHGTATMLPGINLDNLKKGVLGKSEGQLEAYLKTYPGISRVEVNYWPTFISGRIPSYTNRVNISLDNN